MKKILILYFFSPNSCKLLAEGGFGSVYWMIENVNNKYNIIVVLKKTRMGIRFINGKTEYAFLGYSGYKYSFSDTFIGLRLSDLKSLIIAKISQIFCPIITFMKR